MNGQVKQSGIVSITRDWREVLDQGAKLFPYPDSKAEYTAIVNYVVQQVETLDREGGYRGG